MTIWWIGSRVSNQTKTLTIWNFAESIISKTCWLPQFDVMSTWWWTIISIGFMIKIYFEMTLFQKETTLKDSILFILSQKVIILVNDKSNLSDNK